MSALQSATDRALESLRSQVAVVAPHIDPATVVPGVSLADLGCSSMDRAEIVVLTQEDLGVGLSMTELAEAHDVDSLVALLGSRL